MTLGAPALSDRATLEIETTNTCNVYSMYTPGSHNGRMQCHL